MHQPVPKHDAVQSIPPASAGNQNEDFDFAGPTPFDQDGGEDLLPGKSKGSKSKKNAATANAGAKGGKGGTRRGSGAAAVKAEPRDDDDEDVEMRDASPNAPSMVASTTKLTPQSVRPVGGGGGGLELKPVAEADGTEQRFRAAMAADKRPAPADDGDFNFDDADAGVPDFEPTLMVCPRRNQFIRTARHAKASANNADAAQDKAEKDKKRRVERDAVSRTT